MKPSRLPALALASALLLSGCGALPALSLYTESRHRTESTEVHEDTDLATQETTAPSDSDSLSSDSPDTTADSEDYDEAFSACLGDLEGLLSQADYAELKSLFDPLWELRSARRASGAGVMTDQEKEAMLAFSQALDDYTLQYIGDFDSFFGSSTEPSTGDLGLNVGGLGTAGDSSGADEPEEVELLTYFIQDDGTLGAYTIGEETDRYPDIQDDAQEMWAAATAFLPADALTVFDTYTVFTDGEYETLAYVYWDFIDGDVNQVTWTIALDPEDALDEDALQETLLHEYFHYLSLNSDQVDYEGEHTLATYAEDDFEIYTHPDSYLNQFYLAFWPSILVDERLVNEVTDYFFLRHYEDFYDDYAVTDPSEDIAESFAAYVLFSDTWYDDPDLEVWEEKIVWFDQFPELQAFRQQVRANLDADQ